MARFKLVRTSSGLILTTEEKLPARDARGYLEAFRQWKGQAPDGLLVVDDTEFVDVDLPVELDPSVGPPEIDVPEI